MEYTELHRQGLKRLLMSAATVTLQLFLTSKRVPITRHYKNQAVQNAMTAMEITKIKDPEIRAKAKDILVSSGLAVGYGAQPVVLSTPLNPPPVTFVNYSLDHDSIQDSTCFHLRLILEIIRNRCFNIQMEGVHSSLIFLPQIKSRLI